MMGVCPSLRADIFNWTSSLRNNYIDAVKKLLHILFAVVYLFLTAGLTITAHYCGGEIDSVSLLRTLGDKDTCGCEDTSCCDPCCEDEVQTVKITDQHTYEAKFKQNLYEVVISVNLEESTENTFSNHIHFFNGNELLLLNSPPTHILNCSFLI